MKTKQTIAVIGATGNMGSAISRALSNANYRLLLFAKDQAKLQTLVEEIRKSNAVANIESVDCSVNASWEADIILLAVPYQAEKEIAEKIREVANQKVVVSISNPLNTSFNGMLTEPDTSAAEELQKQLPHSKVVKAFNTTFAADFSTPVIDGKQVDSFIAGNHEEALQTASELVVAAGFYPILAGDLSVSRTLENMALLLIQETIKSNYDWLAGWKVLHH
ncbi:NADPH-dependent F420 reductase [Xanthocytophaga agilis]|uniref:NAD(P)-binding domain-containing protein n=1 Tax=Xanthocytophaga agilis TaxID=3048010 RepID=A0AAE3RDQ5_9BACT|nr:NAD(P)-binding domain-containing protein [Xanthocytophaga agilis]MDJ1506785.1 NAD(P)-binding domain-containing protein [Xanthocytophaga agilis]